MRLAAHCSPSCALRLPHLVRPAAVAPCAAAADVPGGHLLGRQQHQLQDVPAGLLLNGRQQLVLPLVSAGSRVGPAQQHRAAAVHCPASVSHVATQPANPVTCAAGRAPLRLALARPRARNAAQAASAPRPA